MSRSRIARWLLFRLERWIQHGWLAQLTVAATLVVLIAGVGGLAAWGATDAFEHPLVAIWWAFLRMTDPGYLGDDQGAMLRTVSMVMTMAGYVLFMGSLVAIMTQALHRRIATLERGLTPIAARGHIVILGWTDRTLDLMRELVISRGRVKRFLKRRGLRSLQLVILAEEITAARRQELAEHVGRMWDVDDIVLRSGRILDADALARVDARQAATLIIPALPSASPDRLATDTRVVKTMMTLRDMPAEAETLPTIVAEFTQPDSQSVAESLTGTALEPIESDRTLARLLAQTTRHPGLAALYRELLSNDHGAALYVQTHTRLDGHSAYEATAWFPAATLVGVIRGSGDDAHTHLNPPPDFQLAPDDRLVLLAHAYDDTLPQPPDSAIPDPPSRTRDAPASRPVSTHRIVCFGWSPRVVSLIQEYSSYATPVHLTVVSIVPTARRREMLSELTLPDHVQVEHREGDYTRAALLRDLDVAAYNTVVLVGSNRFASGEEADARTLMGRLMVHTQIASCATPPAVVVELMDAANAPLLRDYPGDVIVSPALMSRMLAQVTLRRELGSVMGELFGPDGAEIAFHAPSRYGLSAGTKHTTWALQRTVAAHRGTLLGMRRSTASNRTLHLNPPNDTTWTLDATTELVVLATDTATTGTLHTPSS
jgi:hypothetical protein